MSQGSEYYTSGQKAKDEAAAKKANKSAGEKSYNTSAAGLGALAAKIKAEKASPTPEVRPRPTPLTINTPHDLGGTPVSPMATPRPTSNEKE